jgi:hypothetical protein
VTVGRVLTPEAMLRVLALRRGELDEQRARRQRAERASRAVLAAPRTALAGVLVRRLRSLVGEPCGPAPGHGRVCRTLGGGCLECRAIEGWRTALVVTTGADAVVRRYLFP